MSRARRAALMSSYVSVKGVSKFAREKIAVIQVVMPVFVGPDSFARVNSRAKFVSNAFGQVIDF